MSELKYEGNIINNVCNQLTDIGGKFTPLANTVKTTNGLMFGRKGFNLVSSGVTASSISESVLTCEEALGTLVKEIRTKQVAILTYSQDDSAIDAFVDSLSRLEYNSLDLSGIDNKISGWKKLGFLAKGVFASVGAFGAGFVEGVANFGETVVDTGATLLTGAASIFTKPYDLITGSNVTDEMWDKTKAYVAEEQVASVFDDFYANTEFGQSIKENAYGFETVRGIGKGVGYSTAMIFAGNAVGGLIGGAGASAAAKSQMAMKVLPAMAGTLGFGNGAEEGWANGASTGKGLAYGAASGAWETVQWGVGVKINQYGAKIDDIAKVGANKVFKDAATRVTMDVVDSGIEGFVQPGLTMIYREYEGDTFPARYANAFEVNGGWNGVIQQAAIGGFMSATSEAGDVFKYKKAQRAETKANSKSSGGTEASVVKAAGDGTAEAVFETDGNLDSDAQARIEANNKASAEADAETDPGVDSPRAGGVDIKGGGGFEVGVKSDTSGAGRAKSAIKPQQQTNVSNGADARPRGAVAATPASNDVRIGGTRGSGTSSSAPKVDPGIAKADGGSMLDTGNKKVVAEMRTMADSSTKTVDINGTGTPPVVNTQPVVTTPVINTQPVTNVPATTITAEVPSNAFDLPSAKMDAPVETTANLDVSDGGILDVNPASLSGSVNSSVSVTDGLTRLGTDNVDANFGTTVTNVISDAAQVVVDNPGVAAATTTVGLGAASLTNLGSMAGGMKAAAGMNVSSGMDVSVKATSAGPDITNSSVKTTSMSSGSSPSKATGGSSSSHKPDTSGSSTRSSKQLGADLEKLSSKLPEKQAKVDAAKTELAKYKAEAGDNADPKVIKKLEGNVQKAEAEYDKQLSKVKDKAQQRNEVAAREIDDKLAQGDTKGLIGTEKGKLLPDGTLTDESAKYVGEIDGKEYGRLLDQKYGKVEPTDPTVKPTPTDPTVKPNQTDPTVKTEPVEPTPTKPTLSDDDLRYKAELEEEIRLLKQENAEYESARADNIEKKGIIVTNDNPNPDNIRGYDEAVRQIDDHISANNAYIKELEAELASLGTKVAPVVPLVNPGADPTIKVDPTVKPNPTDPTVKPGSGHGRTAKQLGADLERLSSKLPEKQAKVDAAKTELAKYKAEAGDNADPKVVKKLEGNVQKAETDYDKQLTKVREKAQQRNEVAAREIDDKLARGDTKGLIGTEKGKMLVDGKLTDETAKYVSEVDGKEFGRLLDEKYGKVDPADPSVKPTPTDPSVKPDPTLKPNPTDPTVKPDPVEPTPTKPTLSDDDVRYKAELEEEIRLLKQENAEYESARADNIEKKGIIVSNDNPNPDNIRGYDEAVRQIDDQISANNAYIKELEAELAAIDAKAASTDPVVKPNQTDAPPVEPVAKPDLTVKSDSDDGDLGIKKLGEDVVEGTTQPKKSDESVETDEIKALREEIAGYEKARQENIDRKELLVNKDHAKPESVKGYDEAIRQLDEEIEFDKALLDEMTGAKSDTTATGGLTDTGRVEISEGIDVRPNEDINARTEQELRVEAEEKARLGAENRQKVEAEEKARQEAETKQKVEAEEKARQEAETKQKAEAEEKARQEAEAKQKAEEEARLKAEEEARLKAEEEARLKAEEEARLKAEEEARLKAEEEARLKAEEEARLKAEEEARLKAEEEARLKAEEEARLKAEEEARLKAEEEARLKAEEEARIKAEEEVRIKAEEEARLKAEEEARLKAEEEARLKAEEEARLKAEEEARIKAEEEARLKAEEEAKQKAEAEEKARQETEAKRRAEFDSQRQKQLDDFRTFQGKKDSELRKALEEIDGIVPVGGTGALLTDLSMKDLDKIKADQGTLRNDGLDEFREFTKGQKPQNEPGDLSKGMRKKKIEDIVDDKILGKVDKTSKDIDNQTRQRIDEIGKKPVEGNNALDKKTNPDGTVSTTTRKADGTVEVVKTDANDKIINKHTTNPDGSYEEIDYDSNGNPALIKSKLSDGTMKGVEYNSEGFSKETIVNPDKSYQITTRNAEGRIIEEHISDADGNYKSSIYDSNGKLIEEVISKKDGSIEITKNLEDGTYLRQTVGTDGSKYDATYDKDGTLLRVHETRADGVMTDSIYDKSGRLTHSYEKTPDGVYTSNKYDLNGKVVEQKIITNNDVIKNTYSPDGTYMSVKSDASGRIVEKTVTTTSGTVSTEKYNIDGTYTKHSVESNGTVVDSTYDVNGKMNFEKITYTDGSFKDTVISPDGTQYSSRVDANGNIVDRTTITPEGIVRTETNNVDGTRSIHEVKPNGDIYDRSLNSNGNLLREYSKAVDGSYVDMKYDGNGRMLEYNAKNVDGTIIKNSYAADNSYVKYMETPDGKTTTTTGFVDGSYGTKEVYPDGRLKTASYGKDGSLLSSFERNVDGSAINTKYDAEGNYVKETIANNGKVVQKEWTAQGERNIDSINSDGTISRHSEFTSGVVIDSVLGADGTMMRQVETRPDGVTVTSVKNSNGTRNITTRDASGKITERIWTDEKKTFRHEKMNSDGSYTRHTVEANGTTRDYVVDSNGKVTSKTETIPGVGTTKKTYNSDGTFDTRKMDTKGVEFERTWSDTNGTVRTQRLNADGSISRHTVEANGTTRDTKFNRDGKIVSQVESRYDGTRTELEYNPDRTFMKTTTDSNGRIIERKWTTADGTIRTQKPNADGTYSRHTVEASGRVRDTVFGPDGKIRNQIETRVDGSTKHLINNSDGTFRTDVYDKYGRTLETVWTTADGTIRTQRPNADGTYSRHTVDANGRIRDSVLDSNKRLVSQTEVFPDGRKTYFQRTKDGYTVTDHYPDGRVIRSDYDRNNKLIDQVNLSQTQRRNPFRRQTDNGRNPVNPQPDNRRGPNDYRTPVNTPVYRNSKELISNLSNPLTDEKLEFIVKKVVPLPGDLYRNLVACMTDVPKKMPSFEAASQFHKSFGIDPNGARQSKGTHQWVKYTTPQGYKISHQFGFFDHITSKGFDLGDVTDRLYVNISDYGATYKFCELFADECNRRGIPFYLKTASADGSGRIIDPFQLKRDESVVIYSGKKYLAEYANIANDIVNRYNIKLEEPPLLTGKLKNSNIGYGAEPIVVRYDGSGYSFNSLRAEIFEDVVENVNIRYSRYNLAKGTPQYYLDIKKALYEKMKEFKIDPNNFCLNIE